MAENLAYKTSSGCWAYDNSSSNVSKYGYLYNWSTAKNICPAGYHLPSDAEWTTLTNYLGSKNVAGTKLKSSNGWNSYGGNNSSGFSALPGGRRYSSCGSFYFAGNYGYWWSATQHSGSITWLRTLYSGSAEVDRFDSGKSLGFSVRCLRD